MWEERRATLGYLASLKSASFTFACRPCNRIEFRHAGELATIFGEAFTFAALTRRTVCQRCMMPVDGHYRTLELGYAMGMGTWSGPRELESKKAPPAGTGGAR